MSIATDRPMTRKVPRRALTFAAGRMRFAEPVDPNAKTAPITLLARTAEPVNHWYWGRAVHDLAGMELRKDVCPLDWCHDFDINLGYADAFSVTTDGLQVKGELVSVQADDKAAEVMARGRAGVPYEASIDFNGPGLLVEEVGEGVSVQVNGGTFTGPGVVFRQWPLRSVAVCPYGADAGTSSEFADKCQPEIIEVPIQQTDWPRRPGLQTEDHTMSEKTDSKGATGSASATPGATGSASVPPSRADFAAELKKFTDSFGPESGAKMFSEGKSFAEALELHAKALSERIAMITSEHTKALADKDAKIADLEKRLKDVKLGEEKPATFGDDGDGKDTKPPTQRPKEFAHLSENQFKLASGIKLPGKA